MILTPAMVIAVATMKVGASILYSRVKKAVTGSGLRHLHLAMREIKEIGG